LLTPWACGAASLMTRCATPDVPLPRPSFHLLYLNVSQTVKIWPRLMKIIRKSFLDHLASFWCEGNSPYLPWRKWWRMRIKGNLYFWNCIRFWVYRSKMKKLAREFLIRQVESVEISLSNRLWIRGELWTGLKEIQSDNYKALVQL
jgi:hypothetical protein